MPNSARTSAEPVVLVGHSMGGATITGTGERVPDRIRLLIYLTGFLPQDGSPLLSGGAVPKIRA